MTICTVRYPHIGMDDLALLLLEALRKISANTLYKIEYTSIAIFERQVNGEIAFTCWTVLEGLIAYAMMDPALEIPALRCLMLLTVARRQTWVAVACSPVFEKFDYSARILIGMIEEEFDLISDSKPYAKAVIKLSCVEIEAAAPGVLEVIVTYVKKNFETDKQYWRAKLFSVVTKIGKEGFWRVDDDLWADILEMIGGMLKGIEGVAERNAVVKMRGSESVARKRVEVAELNGNVLKGICEAVTMELTNECLKKKEDEGGELPLFDFFERMKKSCDPCKGAYVWDKEDDKQRMAAAYLAAPGFFKKSILKYDGIGKVIISMPLQFYSKIDERLDAALLELACSEKTVAKVFRKRGCFDLSNTEMWLKRFSLGYPWIVARRLACFGSIMRVVLRGSEWKSKAVSEILRVIVVSLGLLPAECLDGILEGKRICFEVLDFLISEGRGINGVPEMFEALGVAFFKLFGNIGITEVEAEREGVREKIMRIYKGKGTSIGIREIAGRFVS